MFILTLFHFRKWANVKINRPQGLPDTEDSEDIFMQDALIQKLNRWLPSALLILYILQVILLPWAVGFTWADPSGNPDHTLTYTINKLTWDSATGIGADGSAIMDLFDPSYGSTVQSGDGRNVVAPGTTKSNIVRLQNNVSGSITYTAVLYEIKNDPSIPVTATVSAAGAASTTSYILPSGVTQDQVVQAITGTVSGKQRVDFDTTWNWTYEDSAQQDAIDTTLGIQGGAKEVTVGLYIIVEDGNSYVTPENPSTGDNSNVGMYAVLMVVSFVLLILLLRDRRREEESEISN